MQQSAQISDQEIHQLWQEYNANRFPYTKSQIMMHYMWLVKYAMSTLNLPSTTILNEEDFLHIGILGLHESIERFELDRGLKFETFAVPRIRGIILDELRRLDWLSRSARKKVQDYIQAMDSLRSSEGREVSSEEIRQKLNVSQEEYQGYLAAAAAAISSLSMNDQRELGEDDEDNAINEIADENSVNTLTRITEEERTDFISNYLTSLPEKKRLVMSLYYYEELTFKEIGELLKVTESRICQIHSQVVQDLRAKLYTFDYA